MADDDVIAGLLASTRRIAVVGASDDPNRPSHGVMTRVLQAGFEVVPVNPNATTVLGIPAVASLAEIDGPVDLVDVFRRVEHTPGVVREAAAIGAPAVWLQSGLRSAEARRLADEAEMTYVEDRCLAVEVAVRDVAAS
ncbi:MAG: CoA-binding protein [Egicoccus sp.]